MYTDQNSSLATADNVSDRDALNKLKIVKEKIIAHDSRFGANIILPKFSSLSRPSEPTINCSLYGDSAQVDDTIHYLSPATMSPLSDRTMDEGGYGYLYKSPSFMRFLHEYEPVPASSYISSSISCHEPELQRTLAIVKPEAMDYEDVILRAIVDAGFSIIRKRYVHLTPEQVSEIYAQYYGSPAFPHMVVSVSVGPVLSICMGAVNAVAKWRDIVGPERVLRADWFFPMSMRVRFGLLDSIPDAVHASETLPEADKENRYVNPESILEPLITEEIKVCDYCNMYINPTLLNGLVDVVRIKPIDPILHLADWLLKNNQFQPRFPMDIALLPT